MSSRELTEWMVYSRLEPLPGDRMDYWGSSIMTLMANSNRDPKRQPYQPSDFLPSWTRMESSGQTPEEMISLMRALAIATQS